MREKGKFQEESTKKNNYLRGGAGGSAAPEINVEHSLQQLVRHQGHAELGRTPEQSNQSYNR